MTKPTGFGIVTLLLLTIGAGCAAEGTRKSATAGSSSPRPASANAATTSTKNPTTAAGRGEPSLEDKDRPAAWIYVDGKTGRFTERDGRPQFQWVIEEPVSATPTFRAEGYAPLLGTPKDFNGILTTVESSDGSDLSYAIAAKEGSFVVGRDYSLVDPGDDFIIRNWTTGDVVRQIAPLPPGTYAFAGGVRNQQTGKEALAVTYFTVGERR